MIIANWMDHSENPGLNPCCNGIYLMIRRVLSLVDKESACLNPCCNGIYLMIRLIFSFVGCEGVLILVVMEYT